MRGDAAQAKQALSATAASDSLFSAVVPGVSAALSDVCGKHHIRFVITSFIIIVTTSISGLILVSIQHNIAFLCTSKNFYCLIHNYLLVLCSWLADLPRNGDVLYDTSKHGRYLLFE
jgi:hypothetical protein